VNKGRLEAFSDGVMAIIITIMVLELHAPEEGDLHALRPLVPVALSYVLSFAFIGIYWNNHHHLLQAVHRVSGGVLWANLHLLFWLSLVPFVTAWMGTTEFASTPVAAYGAVMLAAAMAYTILTYVLIHGEPKNSHLAQAVGRDVKGLVSTAAWLVSIPIALVAPWVSCGIFLAVAIAWFVPDRRIERTMVREGDHSHIGGD
jgi:uncharacterized membrane protein